MKSTVLMQKLLTIVMKRKSFPAKTLDTVWTSSGGVMENEIVLTAVMRRSVNCLRMEYLET